MIKVQGLGRRAENLSHDEAIKHHREIHSKLGIGQSGHMGKYVLFYFQDAVSGTGSALHDLPWDMSALEWFDDAYWGNFMKWLDTEPDGQEVKTDEASFLDRARCYMNVYDENIILDGSPEAGDVNLLRFIKAKPGVTSADAIAYHRSHFPALIKDQFGANLHKYVANYIIQPNSLATGPVAESPVDVIEIYKLASSYVSRFANPSELFNPAELRIAEAEISDSKNNIIFRSEETVFHNR